MGIYRKPEREPPCKEEAQLMYLKLRGHCKKRRISEGGTNSEPAYLILGDRPVQLNTKKRPGHMKKRLDIHTRMDGRTQGEKVKATQYRTKNQ